MKKIIIANWKMCGNPDSAKEWARSFNAAFPAISQKPEVVVCPPSALLSQLKSDIAASGAKIGGQDCHFQPEGAYTGETCANLLKNIGCDYVIVGHSERRSYFNETSEIVRAKAIRAINCGLIPVICIGETADERSGGKTMDVLNQQIAESLPDEVKAGNFIVAYEPVWAIGSGNIPTMEEIKQAHQVIIQNISKARGIDITHIPVLYGGSVKPGNAGEIMAMAEVSGVLVGGASLKADDFLKIIEAGI